MPWIALLLILFNSFAPTIPPTTIPTTTGQQWEKWIELFDKYTIVLTKLMGSITKRAVAWAFFCSILNSFVSSGTTIIPPPPPKNPFIRPTTAPNKRFCQNFTFFINLMCVIWPKIFAFFLVLYYNRRVNSNN